MRFWEVPRADLAMVIFLDAVGFLVESEIGRIKNFMSRMGSLPAGRAKAVSSLIILFLKSFPR